MIQLEALGKQCRRQERWGGEQAKRFLKTSRSEREGGRRREMEGKKEKLWEKIRPRPRGRLIGRVRAME